MVKKFKWKLTPAPKAKLKGYQWVKLNPKDADKTIFKKFQEAPLDGFKFDFADLENKFALQATKAVDAKAAKKDDGVANLLEGKISQNLSIWLSQYKDKTHAQLAKSIMSLDSETFTGASVGSLLADQKTPRF